jgi:hypothetical protein
MKVRLNGRQKKSDVPSFARTLFDGALPVDMVVAGSRAAMVRPGILSGQADREQGDWHGIDLSEE